MFLGYLNNKIINKYAIIDIATLTEEQAKTWFIQELNITEKNCESNCKKSRYAIL